MGCRPIVEHNAAMKVYADMYMPCIFVTSMEVMSQEVVQAIRNSRLNNRDYWDLSRAKLSYWKNMIQENAKDLI
jgi:hypothetical protein